MLNVVCCGRVGIYIRVTTLPSKESYTGPAPGACLLIEGAFYFIQYISQRRRGRVCYLIVSRMLMMGKSLNIRTVGRHIITKYQYLITVLKMIGILIPIHFAFDINKFHEV